MGPVARILAVNVGRLLFKVVYWLAVLAISIVLLILLVRFFESRDQSRLRDGAALPTGLFL